MPTCRSLTLRAGASGPVQAAAAGGAPPDQRDEWVLDIPVRRAGTWGAVLAATAVAPFTPEQAALLQAVAAALSLVSLPPLPSPPVAGPAGPDAQTHPAPGAPGPGRTGAQAVRPPRP